MPCEHPDNPLAPYGFPCETEGDDALSCFPCGLDAFERRSEGEIIEADHLNELQMAIENLERLFGEDPLSGTGYPNFRALLADLFDLTPPPPGEDSEVEMKYHGLVVEEVSASRVRIDCQSLVFEKPGLLDNSVETSPIQALADFTVPGDGGVQAGSPAPGPDQWWEVHLLADSSGAKPPAGYLVPATMPQTPVVRPTGYDASGRVGAVRLNSSGTIVQFLQVDNRVYYKDAQSVWEVTGFTDGWVKVDLHSLVSPFSREVSMMARVLRQGDQMGLVSMNIRFPGSFGDRGLLSVQTGNANGDTDFSAAIVPTDAQRNIEYRVGGDAGELSAEGMVLGYVDRFISSAVTGQG